mmetsp:Transcript_9751/g.36669  ORF Transcript_9751/g.36669 Transcript_9751/m.36669 type:complete len:216 (-) Transcript_9751:1240-1887(-)
MVRDPHGKEQAQEHDGEKEEPRAVAQHLLQGIGHLLLKVASSECGRDGESSEDEEGGAVKEAAEHLLGHLLRGIELQHLLRNLVIAGSARLLPHDVAEDRKRRDQHRCGVIWHSFQDPQQYNKNEYAECPVRHRILREQGDTPGERSRDHCNRDRPRPISAGNVAEPLAETAPADIIPEPPGRGERAGGLVGQGVNLGDGGILAVHHSCGGHRQF